MAGAMLSFGGLLSEILQGGAAGLTASNPGIVKVLGGFVFPVGLVMYAQLKLSSDGSLTHSSRIVLQGQELLTSNMLASNFESNTRLYNMLTRKQYFPMACVKGAVPWWSLPVNWIIGRLNPDTLVYSDLSST